MSAFASAPAMDVVDDNEFWDGLGSTLINASDSSGNRVMSEKQINHMVALLKMLNGANSAEWNYERCDQFAGAIVALVANSSDPDAIKTEINNLLIEMAGQAGAPIVSNTILKVEFYRKLFLRLLGLGMSFTALQMIAPGYVSLILDYAFSLFQTLLTQGFQPDVIATEAASSSPFSAGAFTEAAGNAASGAANLAATASSSLVTAAFYACAQVAGSCLSLIKGAVRYSDCLEFNIDTLAFATQIAAATAATKIAENAVNKIKKPVGKTIGFFMGKMDEEVARYVDSGGLSMDFNRLTQAAVDAYKQSRTRGIAAIETAFNDMANITQEFTQISPNWVPNRFVARDINAIILDKFGESVKVNAAEYKIRLGELISDFSQIDFTNNNTIESSIRVIIQKYNNIKPENAGKLIELIVLWIFAHQKTNTISGYASQPELGTSYVDIHPVEIRTLLESNVWENMISLNFNKNIFKNMFQKYIGAYKDKNPAKLSRSFTVPFSQTSKPVSVRDINYVNPETKTFKERNGRDFSNMNIESKIDSKFNQDLIRALEQANIVPQDYSINIYDHEEGLQQLFAQLEENQQIKIAQIIIKTLNDNRNNEQPTSTGNSIIDNTNREENKIPILFAIVDELKKILQQKAGRRIKSTKAKKSRHNNKKRSTIKRKKARQMARKTRKGKKKRYTQKRR